MLARIIAAQSGAVFYEVSGPEIFSKWYGQSEELLRKLFKDAARQERAIIFFDEIDSVAGQRDDDAHEASKRVVAQLLTLMDGFQPDDNVVVVATTNRPDDIDVALRRPGRFDWEIDFPLPNLDDRVAILEAAALRLKTVDPLPHEAAALQTVGWSGAELAAIWSEAALLAVTDRRAAIMTRTIRGVRTGGRSEGTLGAESPASQEDGGTVSIRSRFRSWRRRRRRTKAAVKSQAPLRKFVYLDEVSVYSLIASKLGPIATEFTDSETTSLASDVEASGGVGMGPLKSGVRSRINTSETRGSQVLRKSIVQTTFKELHDLERARLLLQPRPNESVPSFRGREFNLQSLLDEGPPWVVATDQLVRAPDRLEVELEAEPVYQNSAVVSTMIDLVSESPELAKAVGSADSTRSSPLAACWRGC